MIIALQAPPLCPSCSAEVVIVYVPFVVVEDDGDEGGRLALLLVVSEIIAFFPSEMISFAYIDL